jgi:hypothetical protein
MEETWIQQNIQMSVNFWFVCVEHRKPTRLFGGGDNGVHWSLRGMPIPVGVAHRSILPLMLYIQRLRRGCSSTGRPWTRPLWFLYGLVGPCPCCVGGWAARPQVTLTPQSRSSSTLASKGISLVPLESTGIHVQNMVCLLPLPPMPVW